ncbi:MAG: biopolymer transporter ExbD [Phycisphaerales bacterium]|jgi:biopolymer transport protein ExbD|nr:biopolymer transporter ExbD [Phycisphaerales bacterium]
MLRLRRAEPDMRIELMPLIDVIFLILTFFIYAMVLMVRVDMVPVPLESYASGESPEPDPAIAVTLRLDGSIYVGQDDTGLNGMLDAIKASQAENPELVIYLAVEAGEGSTDRGPLLTSVWDRLNRAGIDIKLVGQPSGEQSP